MDRYQRFSVEWNQPVSIRSINEKTFKKEGETYGTSALTVVRRFDQLAETQNK
ncbi:hypothetical protein [Radiobacillus deserti]|uniref:hypothetical protein n=1 Tax=Radiobacillus deserti TaxID=2594883 RepID=UPI001315919A|nr:hypothetical protein [Radiobacillus deserti]